MNAEKKYDVFLSFNSMDRVQVAKISEQLESRKCRCFIDQSHLTPGQNWVTWLESALEKSGAMALFVGQHGMGRWQQRERCWGIDQNTEDREFRVIPVLLPGCEQPPKGFLKQVHFIDLRDNPNDTTRLEQLAQAILGGNDQLSQAGHAAFCPYRGLNYFREEDAEFFFGRDRFTKRLVQKVKHHSLVAVVGASGSGKSSLVRAGLIPELRKKTNETVWEFISMFPTEQPFASFAREIQPLTDPEAKGSEVATIRTRITDELVSGKTSILNLVQVALEQQPGTEKLLLLVDQWEELYSLCESDDIRKRFIDELIKATAKKDSPLTVVLTVRDDYYGRLLENNELMEQIGEGRVDLSPMTPKELEDVIQEPAKAVGLQIKSSLVGEIRDEAMAEPGNLAMLEFAMEQLWENRSRGPQPELTFEAYTAIGKLAGSIATHAESVYAKLKPEQRDALPGLFRKLVNAGASSKDDTRRRILQIDLDETTRAAASKLADERLLVIASQDMVTTTSGKNEPGDGEVETAERENSNRDKNTDAERAVADVSVEVAHEELLRRWGRLKEWVNKDREFLQWSSRVDLKVEEFERDGNAALLSGRQLQETKKFYPSRQADLGEKQRSFLDNSLKAAATRTRFIAGGVCSVVLTIAFAGFSWYSYDQSQRDAKRQQDADFLVERFLDTESIGVGFYLAQLEPHSELAFKKLVEAWKDTDRPQLQRAHAAYALIEFDFAESAELPFLLDNVPTIPKDEGANLINALAKVHEQNSLEPELDVRIDRSKTDSERNRYLAVALGLGITGKAKEVCKLDKDPSLRTSLIHEFKDFPGDLERVARLLSTYDADVRSALLLAFGQMSGEQISSEIIRQVDEIYKNELDQGGPHAAAGWALRQWEQPLPTQVGSKIVPINRNWYVNSQKMTMVLIPAGEFQMGSPDREPGRTGDEEVHTVELSAFWISDREVSVDQFNAVMGSVPNRAKKMEGNKPVTDVSWFDAVNFCNEMSKSEGLTEEECYYKISNPKNDEDGRLISADVTNRSGKGYRLPTEAEWEYACRAKSSTQFYYGDEPDIRNPTMLSSYAVYKTGNTNACGSKMPNGWGLFDMHGNVYEWCADWLGDYEPEPSKDPTGPAKGESRVLRGGSFSSSVPLLLRSADRSGSTPGSRDYIIGFRISRTP